MSTNPQFDAACLELLVAVRRAAHACDAAGDAAVDLQRAVEEHGHVLPDDHAGRIRGLVVRIGDGGRQWRKEAASLAREVAVALRAGGGRA